MAYFVTKGDRLTKGSQRRDVLEVTKDGRVRFRYWSKGRAFVAVWEYSAFIEWASEAKLLSGGPSRR